MSDGAFPDRLTQLRNRWEADPSSRVFLQLAEEYRHQGRLKEALDVLDRGLQEHPGYLSALVAKGRCHLELGEPERARAVLERVVKQDATQMVANKLLVRAYLDTSEPERARERLDLYSLLNDSDPEIEELRRRLRAMERSPQAAKPGSLPAPVSPFPQAASAPPAGGDVFALGSPAERRDGGDVFELDLPAPRAAAPRVRDDEPFADLYVPPAVPAPVAAVAAPEPEAEPEDALFPGLASRDSRRRYLDSLASGGLFLLDLTPAPVRGMETPRSAAADLTPVQDAWEPPLEEPAPAVLAAPPITDLEPYPDLAEALLGEPAPAVVEEPPAAEEISFPPLPETAEGRREGGLESAMLAPEAPAPAAAEPVATATLGELYLRQGHLAEAERIFREVLRREPDSAAAHEGLARAAARREERRPLAARELLAGYEPGPEGGEAEARARKVFLLNSYLKRLRRGGQRGVS